MLLAVIVRDQRRAVAALEAVAPAQVDTAAAPAAVSADSGPRAGSAAETAGDTAPAAAPLPADGALLAVASVERGRIASLSGLVALIWLAILVLMVWNS